MPVARSTVVSERIQNAIRQAQMNMDAAAARVQVVDKPVHVIRKLWKWTAIVFISVFNAAQVLAIWPNLLYRLFMYVYAFVDNL